MNEVRCRTATEEWGDDVLLSAMLDNDLLSDIKEPLKRCQKEEWEPTEAEARPREFCDLRSALKGRKIGAMLGLHQFDSLESPEALVARLGSPGC